MKERDQVARMLEAQLGEKEQALQFLMSEVEGRDKIILAREEAIAGLKGELKEAQEQNQPTKASNESLVKQLAE